MTNLHGKASWTLSLLGVLTAFTPVNLMAQDRVLLSGIETQNISPTLTAGDDFYEYVNAKWLAETEIPPDLSNYGAFTALDEETKKQVRALIDKAAKDPNTSGPGRQVGNFYNSYTNVARRNELGLKPVQPLLDVVAGVQDKGEWINAIAALNRVGVGNVFGFYIEPDEKQSDQYAIYLEQSGTTLPDRDFYLENEPQYEAARESLKTYATQLLNAAGHGDKSAALAEKILAFETELAKVQWTKTKMRDSLATYNKVKSAEYAVAHPELRWVAYSKVVGLPAGNDLIVREPSFFEGVNSIVAATDLETLKAYTQFRILDTYADVLSEDLEKLHFQLHKVALSGISEQEELWKRGVQACNALLGMPVGQLYVAEHFSPAAKARMGELVENLKKAFAVRIQNLDWMGEGTKKRATEKLQMINTKIGYPDVWKDYSSVKIVPDDLVANVMALAEFEHTYETAKLGKPIDRNEWHMVPQQVNAYYNPVMNEIVFPAAILQPPFFNLAADDAVNYGGIGAVIGHEISHAFDDQGSQYDGHGNLQNWWTEHDREEFEKRAKLLVAQYGAYKPFADAALNGDLTLGENIGDLGGLSAAYTAYEISLNGKDAPVIDSLTGPQRFFMGWSQVWRRKYTEQELRKRLLTDPHSPSQYRTNGIVSNIDAFYKAFDIKPDSKIYIAPENRVRIW
jgi:endothelin-converting enzyme/putative endopeptidase